MLIALWSWSFPSAIVSELGEAGWLHTGRFFYFLRLVAALLAATLIPILIDRRLRR